MSAKNANLNQDFRYLILDYLYCDASNYKSFGSVLLTGTLTNAERAELIACLESGEFFVAEQVGVPPLYATLFQYSGGPTEDDHAWHKFEGFREKTGLADSDEIRGNARDILALFRAAKQNWHPELSPNF